MPRVYRRKARKDYPNNGITKGDMYYYCKRKTGPRSSLVMRQKTPFRRSQLTGSEYLTALYDIEDGLQTITEVSEATEYAERFRELGQEQQDKFDNMPEGLQSGDTGQMIEERAQACEEASDQIDALVDAWDPDSVDTSEETIEEAEADVVAQIQEITADA